MTTPESKQAPTPEAQVIDSARRPLLEDMRQALGTYLADERFDRVRELVTVLHPAEIAALMTGLSGTHRNLVFDLIDVARQHEVITELEESDQERMLERLDDKRIGELLLDLDSDDAADLAGLLDETTLSRVLEATPEEDRKEVVTLLEFDEESAGGLMAVELVTVTTGSTVRDAIDAVRKAREDEMEDIHYVYVVDKRGRLKGRIEIMNLVLAKRSTLVKDVLDDDMIVIGSDMDQEEVAQLFARFDLISAPVVDEKDRLIGRITVDDVVDVVAEEANEDLGLLAGTGEEVVTERSLLKATQSRLPWLLLAFIGELFGALVVSQFEESIASLVIIAAFIPVIIAVAGNIGIQTSTIVVRGLATGDIASTQIFSRLHREIAVSLMSGVVLAAVLIGVSWFWMRDPNIALSLALSLIAVVILAAAVGSIVPFILKALNQDPALASGPFITMTNDVFGLLIYLAITSSMLM
jgi:magnesium transporter